MSSGGISIAPGAVGVAAAAVTVATVAAAAVLAVRAANAAAEGAVRTSAPSGAPPEQRHQAADQARARVAGLVWDEVAAIAVEVNARIRLLTERAARRGVAVALPKPVSLVGLTVQQVAHGAALAAAQLDGAQAAMWEAVATDEGRRVAAHLPPSVLAQPNAAATLAQFQSMLRERYAHESSATGEASVTTQINTVVTATDVETILLTLDQDANEREHADVLTTAAYVLREDPREVRSCLRALQSKVAAVNDAVARRRLAAQWLSALEEPVVAAVEPPRPFLGTAARLRAVVAGDEDLTPELRAQATEAVEWAADVTRRCFVREVIGECLAEQGYTIDEEFDPRHAAELRLTRSDWQEEHSAELWIDRRGVLHARLVREQPRSGDQAAARDRARHADFNDHIRALGRKLRADVVTDDGYKHHGQ